ncbi:uncharacterized protein [Lepeophtheirus salmonis]|uniref:uncharacterized protein n=1 Tax=Lepeophtheirus salmonis TaxID=72036 RepID=UPI001AE65FF0|nr:pseudouridine-metabolizing bifunctional protein C1861.05-like [Lepeophtheirus salmonis]
MSKALKRILDVSSRVKTALRNGDPIVALESTILTHGMPYPVNVEMAQQVEEIIRSKGVTPATIGILGGKVRVGLSGEEIEMLSKCKSGLKVSRRDLPYVLSDPHAHGGTTVSATSLLAHSCGIHTFVTGGIGGVHRGAEVSMDISADLFELQQTPITVVSAGIKSILDIEKTLEVLETLGVCVVTYASSPQTSFPAFFSRESGFLAPYTVASARKVAEMMKVRDDLKLNSGMLVGVPIPLEHEALDAEKSILNSVKEAAELGIKGREVTPFVLSKVSQLTQGDTLKANLALIKNNAIIGSEIAKEYSILSSKSTEMPLTPIHTPIVVGGAAVDLIAQFLEPKLPLDGATHKGKIDMHFGGVGRNIAQGLAQLNLSPVFVSSVGKDNLGASLKQDLEDDTHVSTFDNKSTATYCVITNDKGDVQSGIGDMNVHNDISPELIRELDFSSCPLVVMDGNIPVSTMNEIKNKCLESNPVLLFEPTDVHKAHKPFINTENISAITYISPNERELECILKEYNNETASPCNLKDKLNNCIDLCQGILTHVEVIMVTLAENGILLVRRGSSNDPLPLFNNPNVLNPGSFPISAKHYPVLSAPSHILSSSGAGDCLIAGFMASVLKNNHQDKAIGVGMQLARQSLEQVCAVPKTFQHLDWDYSATGTNLL